MERSACLGFHVSRRPCEVDGATTYAKLSPWNDFRLKCVHTRTQ